MPNFPVDQMSTDTLNAGVAIGDAMRALEECIARMRAWRFRFEDTSIHETEHSKTFWELVNHNVQVAKTLFRSPAHELRLLAAIGVSPLADGRPKLQILFNDSSVALICVYDSVAAERASVAATLERVSDEVARHTDLMKELRANTVYSQGVFEKIVLEPILAPPINKLVFNGVSENAIWDAIKAYIGMPG